MRAATVTRFGGPEVLEIGWQPDPVPGPDDTVLVVGASGGLGVLSVQLARARAARVVAIARGAKLAGVRRLGPDAVIDSGQPDWLAQARAAGGQ